MLISNLVVFSGFVDCAETATRCYKLNAV